MGTGERVGTERSRLATASVALVGVGALVASLAWLGGPPGPPAPSYTGANAAYILRTPSARRPA